MDGKFKSNFNYNKQLNNPNLVSDDEKILELIVKKEKIILNTS